MLENDKLSSPAETDIESALKDREKFKRLIPSHHELIKIIEKFPQFAFEIMRVVLRDEKVYKQIINPFVLPQVMKACGDQIFEPQICLMIQVTLYSLGVKIYLEPALNNVEEFKRLIENKDKLMKLAEIFPLNAPSLIKMILENVELFRQYIKSVSDLSSLKIMFAQSDEDCQNVFLANPEELGRIITSQSERYEVANIFSRHIVFQKHSIDEVYKAIKKSHMEIRKCARLFHQATRTGPTFFASCPNEGLAKIAKFVGNQEVHDEKLSLQIFSNHFGRPQ
jgi:hypothetical protein